MKMKDIIVSEDQALTISPADSNPNNNTSTSTNVSTLAANVTSLNKQIQDLQKSALQGSSSTPTAQTPGNIASLQSTGTNVVSTATNNGINLDQLKQLAGIQQQIPGVTQSPAVTAQKIKQQLMKNQSGQI